MTAGTHAITNVQSGDNDGSKWKSNTAFLFAAVGAAIGLGNIVRFPFLAFRHGGAAFLIPYLLALVLLGLPILGLEFMLGQRMRAYGAIRSLALVHARAWGVGAVAVFASVLIMLTYNVVMAWSWVFLFNAFKTHLPWGLDLTSSTTFFTESIQGIDATYKECGIIPGGADTCGLGKVQWQLVLGLGVQYILLFLALSKGKKLVGKVVMVTMPLPFFMLCVIFFYALTLDGHGQGVSAYIGKLDVGKLGSGGPWVDGVAQIFYGIGLASGGLIAYGAGNPSDAKVVMNTWIVGLSNSLFSFFSGFAVFMVIGFLADQQGRTVGSYEDSLGGYSLAFKTFPVALNHFPPGAAQFFCVLFFAMLILLGFDSAMLLVEGVVAALKDWSPCFERHEGRCVGLVCSLGFAFGLVFCTQGGEAVLDIIDHFSSTYCLLLVGLLECIVVGWVYDLVPIDDESASIMESPSAEDKARADLELEAAFNGLPAVVGQGPGSSVKKAQQQQEERKGRSSGNNSAAAAAAAVDQQAQTQTKTKTRTSNTPISLRVPPLLDPRLSTMDRIRHGVFSSRLQREIAHMTGQDPNYLPFAWAVLVKLLAPVVILSLMVYNIKQDAEGSGYGGYPAWANAVFGWVCCLVLPAVMLATSWVRPLELGAEAEATTGGNDDSNAAVQVQAAAAP